MIGFFIVLLVGLVIGLIVNTVWHCEQVGPFGAYGNHSRWWRLVQIKTTGTKTKVYTVMYRFVWFPFWVEGKTFHEKEEAEEYLNLYVPSTNNFKKM